jgi:hypothetical protein
MHHLADGSFLRAMGTFAKALRIYKEIGDVENEGKVEGAIGDAAAGLENFSIALEVFYMS